MHLNKLFHLKNRHVALFRAFMFTMEICGMTIGIFTMMESNQVFTANRKSAGDYLVAEIRSVL